MRCVSSLLAALIATLLLSRLLIFRPACAPCHSDILPVTVILASVTCSMHRISVFRDDVIFVIYMVQRRMYPVDSSRPAEGYEVDGENEDGGAPGGAAVDADSKKTK